MTLQPYRMNAATLISIAMYVVSTFCATKTSFLWWGNFDSAVDIEDVFVYIGRRICTGKK